MPPEAPCDPRATVLIRGAGPRCEDRAEVFCTAEATVIVVADGAGGIGGGQEAADAVVAAIRRRPPTRDDMVRDGYGVLQLLDLDEALHDSSHGGQAAAVVVAVGSGQVRGAGVGDCQAWLMCGEEQENLTAGQARSPLLGSGAAMPRPFVATAAPGRLLVASDGLFRYASPRAIRSAALRDDPQEAAGWLLSLVELPSGALQDDVAVVLCDIPPGPRSR